MISPGRIVLLLAVAAFLWIAFRAGRDRELFVLSVRGGRTRVVRGRLPPSLLEALSDVMASAKVQRATLRVFRDQSHARVEASGLNEWVLQRARNVVGTYPLARLVTAPPAKRRR